MANLRTLGLPIVNYGRKILANSGLRTTRVIIRSRQWTAGTGANEVGKGTVANVDVELSPRPKVTELSPGIVRIGPITPAYVGGGYSLDDLYPDEVTGTRRVVTLIGPTGDEMDYVVTDIDHAKNFRYELVCESLTDARPRKG